jgi:hypothetical protein
MKDLIPGGKSDKKPDSAFDAKQLQKGIKVEREHTKNKQLAKEIAKDHLSEFSDYYDRLEKMEKSAHSKALLEKIKELTHKISASNEHPITKGLVLSFFATNIEIGVIDEATKKPITIAKINKSFKRDSQSEVIELAKEIFNNLDASGYIKGMDFKAQPYYRELNQAYLNFKKRLSELSENQLEKMGLGKHPYKYLGAMESPSKELQEQNPEAYNNALRNFPRFDAGGIGSCARCYNAITIHHIIKSSDGKVFPLGSECVWTLNDNKIESEVKKEKTKIEKSKRDVRNKAKLSDLEDIINNPELIKKMKSMSYKMPAAFSKWDEGKRQWYLNTIVGDGTYYDYVLHMIKISGTSGQQRILKEVKKDLGL